jgi:DNA transposition AAA+ family ATPase
MATKRVRLPPPKGEEGSAFTPLTIEPPPPQPFLATREHARFVEFAEACAHYRYIGVCHGRPGVGKTRSASEFAQFPDLLEYGLCNSLSPKLARQVAACQAVLYTATVSNTPRSLGSLGTDIVKLGGARITLAVGTDAISWNRVNRACPLVIVDEADRLTINSLEHLRHMSDKDGFGLILMGMPGLEKRLARYAQLYSRIGFVHEFKALSEAEMCMLLAKHAGDFGIAFNQEDLDAVEAQAAAIRITRGNFRLMERLFAQMRRIMTINRTNAVTVEIVEAARDCLVIGAST